MNDSTGRAIDHDLIDLFDLNKKALSVEALQGATTHAVPDIREIATRELVRREAQARRDRLIDEMEDAIEEINILRHDLQWTYGTVERALVRRQIRAAEAVRDAASAALDRTNETLVLSE